LEELSKFLKKKIKKKSKEKKKARMTALALVCSFAHHNS
jgi:hypothetical protein